MEKATKFFESLPQRFEREKALPIVSIAVATTAAIFTSYKLLASRSNKHKQQGSIKEIPEPGSAYPYFGHIFSLGKLPGNTVSQWHAELGPIIKLRMGVRTWIMVDDSELAHKIFVTHGAETSYRPHLMFAYYYSSMEGK
jgi:hypothetical protein